MFNTSTRYRIVSCSIQQLQRSNMAAQTGSTYISGNSIDSVAIQTVNLAFSTMTSSRKCSQMIATTTDYGTV